MTASNVGTVIGALTLCDSHMTVDLQVATENHSTVVVLLTDDKNLGLKVSGEAGVRHRTSYQMEYKPDGVYKTLFRTPDLPQAGAAPSVELPEPLPPVTKPPSKPPTTSSTSIQQVMLTAAS